MASGLGTFLNGRPLPPAVALLGWTFSSFDQDTGELEAFFHMSSAFTNLQGTVQGGFVSAMLDATLSGALLSRLDDDQFAPTVELKSSYLRPIRPGRVAARGRVLHRGGSLAFLAGEIYTPDGEVAATGSATAKIVRG